MTAIKQLRDAKNGNPFFPKTHTKAVVDDNGNSVESVLDMQTQLINQAQMEAGTVPSDVAPTENSTNWVTSGGVFNATTVGNNVEIDLTEYTAVRAYPNPDIWIVSSSQYPYYGMFIPVKAGQKYLITAQSETLTYYGFLTTNTYSHNANVSYATGCTRVTVPAGETVIDTAPSDAKYVWICTYTTEDRTPQSFAEYHKTAVRDYINNSDSVPTEDSVNLVTSGGVYNSIQDVLSEISDKTTITDTSENIISGKTAEKGYVNSSTGKWVSDSSQWTGYFITVAAGDMYIITASSYDVYCQFLPNSSHTNASEAVIIERSTISANMSSIVTVPDGATCMWISCNAGGTDRTPSSIYRVHFINEFVEDLNEEIAAINNSVFDATYAVESTTTLNLTCSHSTSTATYKQYYKFTVGRTYRITLSVSTAASESLSLVDLPRTDYSPWITVMSLPQGSLSRTFIYTPSSVNGYLQAYSETNTPNGKAVTAVIEKFTTLKDINDDYLLSKTNISTNSEDIAKIEDQIYYESGMTYKNYTGNRITPNRIGFKAVGSLVTGQSAAVFGDVAFVFGNGATLCTAYNMKTRTLIKSGVYINGAPSREDGTAWHCNSSEFGTNYYAEGDAFPLLYIGGSQGDAIHELLVCRVVPDASRVYHLDVVQVLTMPDDWGYANVAFDEERGKIILCRANMIFRVCNPPAVVDGEGNPISTYTFTEEDVEQTITIDASSFPVAQDVAMHRGLLYLGNGHGSGDNAFFRVIDLYNGTLINDISIAGWFTDSAEGYSFYNEHLYIFGSANIYKLWFM